MPSSTKMFGLLARKERWWPSWRGWLALVVVLAAAAWIVVRTIYPFLAVTHRVATPILVVEGWVPQFAAEAAAAEFRTGGYERVFTTGGPVEGTGGYTNDYNTAASVGAGRLRDAGVPADRVQMVPSRIMDRDRTYTSAVALREWFRDHDLRVTAVNVLTVDAHARRTWLLFQKALGPDIRVGIICAQNPDFDPRHWWRYSEGVREVTAEALAYLYARLLFWPSATANNK